MNAGCFDYLSFKFYWYWVTYVELMAQKLAKFIKTRILVVSPYELFLGRALTDLAEILRLDSGMVWLSAIKMALGCDVVRLIGG